MKERIFKMFAGDTIAAIGIAFVLNSGLGCFAESAAYKGVSLATGLPLFLATFLVEGTLLTIATIKGEGLGWSAVVNATYGAFVINIFHNLLPTNTLFCLGVMLMPIGWSILEKARFGSTCTNILMKALMKTTGKSLAVIRTCIELMFLTIAYLTAPQYITWFTIFLTFGTPILLKYVYKIIGHSPAEIEHDFIIGNKNI